MLGLPGHEKGSLHIPEWGLEPDPPAHWRRRSMGGKDFWHLWDGLEPGGTGRGLV